MKLKELIDKLDNEEKVAISFFGNVRFDREQREVKVKDVYKAFKDDLFDKEVMAHTKQKTVTGYEWRDIWLFPENN